MEVISKFEIAKYVDVDGCLNYYSPKEGKYLLANLTGWKYLFKNGHASRQWFLQGRPSTPQEVFDLLTDEDKEKAIWELDEWK